MLGLPDIEPVYLDHAATTPVAAEVVEAMRAALDDFGNPSSDHQWGGKAAQQVDAAAEALGAALGVAPETLVWTSGATESDNLAIIGAARYRAPDGGPSPGLRRSPEADPGVVPLEGPRRMSRPG